MKYVIGIIINGKCILYMYKAFHFTTILINLPRTRLSVHVESFLICSISCTSFSSVVDMVLSGASFSLQNSNKANNVKSSKIIHFAGVFN